MTNFRFLKSERLKGQKIIERLFQTGESIYKYPVRAVYNFTTIELNDPRDSFIKVGFSVPKRKLKSAVKRNLIRRRLREAYRLKRTHIINEVGFDPTDRQLHLILIYQHDQILEYKVIEKSVEKLLKAVLSDVSS